MRGDNFIFVIFREVFILISNLCVYISEKIFYFSPLFSVAPRKINCKILKEEKCHKTILANTQKRVACAFSFGYFDNVSKVIIVIKIEFRISKPLSFLVFFYNLFLKQYKNQLNKKHKHTHTHTHRKIEYNFRLEI